MERTFKLGQRENDVRRRWMILTAMFAVAVVAFAGTAVMMDRSSALAAAKGRTSTMSVMMAAHAEVTIAYAESVLQEIEARIADWDFKDDKKGRLIFEEVRDALRRIPAFSSAWVVDAAGVSRLDTWSFPARPYSALGRQYFKLHRAGTGNKLIVLGDEGPGVVTGRERFTISRAQRNQDGSLRSIVVVAIYSNVFESLYRKSATWPAAGAGLYSAGGHIVVRSNQQAQVSQEFLSTIERSERAAEAGSEVRREDGELRLASWHWVGTNSSLYAMSSQPISAVLAGWRVRALVTAVAGVGTIILFGLFASRSAQAARVREAARFYELLLREVHHRVKNALTLMISIVNLQARKQGSAELRGELQEVSRRLRSVAEIQSLLESTHKLGKIELGGLLKNLCEHLDKDFGKTVHYAAEAELEIDQDVAMPIAIVANELVTNGLKHGREIVSVHFRKDNGSLVLTVASDGPLPVAFSLESVQGFGLRMAKSMAEGHGGQLTVSSNPAGAVFEFRLPVPAEK